MNKHLLAAAVAAVAVLHAPGTAAELTVGEGYSIGTRLTYTTAAAVASSVTGGSYTGVGGMFIEVASTATTGLGYICSGAMLSSNVVLTAGHCLSDYDGATYDPVTAVTFYLPSLGASTISVSASSWTASPFYDGDPTHGGDFGLLTLGELVTGVDTYSLYEGDPLAEFTRVGSGTVGGPRGTDTGGVTQDYLQRSGKNLFEYTGDLVTGWSENILLSDFDDGTNAHDVFGRLLGASARQSGITGESNSSPGDSGGPIFINGQIVGVTSFGITGDAFRANGYCGGFNGQNSIDPYGDGGTTGIQANLRGCTNSSVGEMSGDTWMLPYKSYVDSYVAYAVPEPATWMQMIAGLGLLGMAMRRSARARLVSFA